MSHHFEKLPIALDAAHLAPNVTRDMIEERRELVRFADKRLRSGECPGSDFTQWLDPDSIMTAAESARLRETARELGEQTDVLMVIGIGGSYLGARAAIEALAERPERVVYAGQNISAHYMGRLRSQLSGKRVAINVISKTGSTTETSVALRLMRDLAGETAKKWIIATTDEKDGALLKVAERQGYKKFVFPKRIGGRYSVLSASGLLPIAYAGVDTQAMVAGAAGCARLCSEPDPLQNPAYFYAAARNVLYSQGYAVELLASFEPRLHYVAEWWKQLYGESEGKQNMALFPASVDFTTDLHSMGQYIQQGRRFLAETFLIVEEGEPPLKVPDAPGFDDGLDYLAGREVSYINSIAYTATAQAHRDGGVPNMTVALQRLDAYSLGALMYFFEVACGVSGLMLGVNPFDQPGVDAYKNLMFELLGKPGYESNQTAARPDYIRF